jgi:hypothetical protein
MIDDCPGCGLALATAAIIPMLQRTEDGMIVLGKYTDQMSAEILIGRLESEGIHAHLSAASSIAGVGIIDFARLLPFRVLLWPQDAVAALRILAEDEHWTDDQLARYMSMLEEAPPD